MTRRVEGSEQKGKKVKTEFFCVGEAHEKLILCGLKACGKKFFSTILGACQFNSVSLNLVPCDPPTPVSGFSVSFDVLVVMMLRVGTSIKQTLFFYNETSQMLKSRAQLNIFNKIAQLL
jgi:hypothetical protein